MKYHINGQGEPGRCSAQNGNCPFGTDEAHYGSASEARLAYEARMESQERAENIHRLAETPAVRSLVPREGQYEQYYADTDRKHFTDKAAPGSKFLDPALTRLEHVGALALMQRGNLDGDDREALIQLGGNEAAFHPDFRYLLVRTRGAVGAAPLSSFPPHTEFKAVRTKTGGSVSLVASVEKQYEVDYAVLIMGKAQDQIITAHPGSPSRSGGSDTFGQYEGQTLTAAQIEAIAGTPNVHVNTILAGVGLTPDARTFTMAPDPTDPNFPGRAPVEARSWDQPDLAYAPHSYVTPKIAKRINVGGEKNVDPNWHARWETEVQWADGRTPRMSGGLPLNPAGRTGLTGLGGCKRLGENKAADPIITRESSEGKLQVLLGYKEVEQQWAIPGGSVDEGEDPAVACSRELQEEVGLVVDMSKGSVVYQGFVDDHRNTDNAWFSTQARHVHLKGSEADQTPRASDDISAARWVNVEEIEPQGLFASHGKLLAAAGLFKRQPSDGR